MDKGTKLIYSGMGFYSNGKPCSNMARDKHELTFDQFVDGNVLGITKSGVLMKVNPDNCKLAKPEEYFGEKPKTPILG